MSTEIKNVMVLGGRGNLGPYLIRALVKAGFSVSVLSRTSSNVTDSMFLDAAVVKSDYTFPSLVDVFTGQDAVISTLSTANIAEQKIVIDAVAAAKVKRFMPSEFGSDTSVDGLEKMAPFLKGKQDVMDYVKSKEADGLSWTAIFTGPWIDWMLVEGKGLLCLDVKTKTGELVDSGEPKFTTTTASQVGQATAAALLRSDKTKNEYVHVASYNTSQNQVIEALERMSGTKFQLENLDNKDLYARATKHIEEGNWGRGYYELATATVYSDAPVTYFPDKAAHWMKVLGLAQDETFDEMISRVLKTV
ncbi:related to 2`-hydroxyisoflavone reductase [Fusarium fujikuroi]|uniref:Related to 2`-hydroxyisoflavone reductase n=1 Tax=Gibberella fujikuroi (strain CBS 195.34 / IMI 58289 / NRRL A-6831) TaxID=1279085 RepID=S0DXR7_GIBF5|nr:related to 2`-hydroxyisoflavone reductase [Fusarium fujikuroi IMI 58289]KLO98675.1 2`-hydroxyisoflavone reductase [Fusarium fujikuroi]KLO99456.1 2`-hydroxyisoflavone reductase [Fusarium fujikuroi]CCT65268.1 related to 2`-hydroxyisoflavone reductase [Fusarium fujikuroi IMI 58289]SCO01304.1 related to 2`-hydroxyisoflavone reductase [Fusarium fujikuroi]SCO23938.1 related to 2`-hydroxyisoflavone reductase [Fusarium fujikuroi]